MVEVDIAQELLDAFALNGTPPSGVFFREFCDAVINLQSMSQSKFVDPTLIVKALGEMQESIGPYGMSVLFDPDSKACGRWTKAWCPQPLNVKLASADCPQGTLPLWCNGERTVYARSSEDERGNFVYVFCLTKED
jgi:hypothetical protein